MNVGLQKLQDVPKIIINSQKTLFSILLVLNFFQLIANLAAYAETTQNYVSWFYFLRYRKNIEMPHTLKMRFCVRACSNSRTTLTACIYVQENLITNHQLQRKFGNSPKKQRGRLFLQKYVTASNIGRDNWESSSGKQLCEARCLG